MQPETRQTESYERPIHFLTPPRIHEKIRNQNGRKFSMNFNKKKPKWENATNDEV